MLAIFDSSGETHFHFTYLEKTNFFFHSTNLEMLQQTIAFFTCHDEIDRKKKRIKKYSRSRWSESSSAERCFERARKLYKNYEIRWNKIVFFFFVPLHIHVSAIDKDRKPQAVENKMLAAEECEAIERKKCYNVFCV